MIPIFAAAGLRAIAVDHIGFGRSDKLTRAPHYTFEGHIDRLAEFVTSLGLSGITLVCQDWGGPIGMGVLARQPDRFARVVAGNTMLHTAESELDGRIACSPTTQPAKRIKRSVASFSTGCSMRIGPWISLRARRS